MHFKRREYGSSRGAPYLRLLLIGSQRARGALLGDQFEGMRLTQGIFAVATRIGTVLGRRDHNLQPKVIDVLVYSPR